MAAFREAALETIKEYFASSDASEVASIIEVRVCAVQLTAAA